MSCVTSAEFPFIQSNRWNNIFGARLRKILEKD